MVRRAEPTLTDPRTALEELGQGIQRKTRLHRCKASFDWSWILSRLDSINLGPSILRQLGLCLPCYQSRILPVFLRVAAS